MSNKLDRDGDRNVLKLIGGGIILIILCIIASLALHDPMPDYAESVFGAIIGGAVVKLSDVLAALVSLSTGREREKLTDQLSQSTPAGAPQQVEVVNPPDNPVPVESNP